MTFIAYGDNSESNNVVTNALVLASGDAERRLCDVLGELKEKAGGRRSSRIHCREMLRPEARKKTEWAHLDENGVLSLYSTLAGSLRAAGADFFVSFADRREVAAEVDFPDGRAMVTLREHLLVYAFWTLAGILDARLGWGPGHQD